MQRVETRWHLDEQSNWRPGPAFMVCGEGHRVPVEPVDDYLDGAGTSLP